MAFGIESRPVMVDPRFEAICLRVPGSLKLRDGQSKWLLRRALSQSLPASVLQRRDKLGFPVPDRLWRSGAFHRWLCDMALRALDETASLLDDILDVPYTRRALQIADSRGVPLWALASLQVWSQRFTVNLR
jgi:asparagine synthase (glutamine-hydrolysing)